MPNPIVYLVNMLFSFYIWVLIGGAVLSWLTAFNVVNVRHPLVAMFYRFFYALTEPVLRPIRRYVPSVGGLDLSFLVLFFAVQFLQYLANWMFAQIGW